MVREFARRYSSYATLASTPRMRRLADKLWRNECDPIRLARDSSAFQCRADDFLEHHARH